MLYLSGCCVRVEEIFPVSLHLSCIMLHVAGCCVRVEVVFPVSLHMSCVILLSVLDVCVPLSFAVLCSVLICLVSLTCRIKIRFLNIAFSFVLSNVLYCYAKLSCVFHSVSTVGRNL